MISAKANTGRLKWLGTVILLVFSQVIKADIDVNQFQCVAEYKSERLNHQSRKALQGFEPNASRYVDSYTSVDVLIDVRERFELLDPPDIQLKQALRIPLYSLKTKRYLKDKRLILVGTGFDDFLLEKEITKLHKIGFRSIKIMRFGITSLLGDRQLGDSLEMQMALRMTAPEDVISARLEYPQGFFFINLNDQAEREAEYGFESHHLPFSDTQAFYRKLSLLIKQKSQDNAFLRVILYHNQQSVYKRLLLLGESVNAGGIFFVQGGERALVSTQSELLETDRLSKKIKRRCG